ncbi:MAG: hypothetical protein HQL25_04980 [Candidatus Omnitrophica bacterium]|nr:hypothetical protein [Candidatus Omnitrophota bacterium]
MKKILNNHAITLAELLIATVLIGIVMLGIVGFDLTIKRFGSTSQRSALLHMEAMSIAARISADVSNADGNVTDSAIRSAIEDLATPGVSLWIAFRSVSPPPASVTSWIYYRHDYPRYRICRWVGNAIYAPPMSCAANSEIISSQVVVADFRYTSVTNCNVKLYFQLRQSPTLPVNPMQNPQVEYTTIIRPPQQSCS